MQELPMKRSLQYPEQCNVKIDAQLKADIRFLDGQGVEVAELLRCAMKAAVERAKAQLEKAG
jgi:post-segregation antitoxin (ccd killing protein)